MRAQPKASHFIGGEYVEDTDGAVIDVIFPATGEVIAKLHAATPTIVDKALYAAKSAQGAWAAMTGTERGRILRRAADIMRERNHDLSVLETLDTGKPYQETSVADATSGADAMEYFGGIAGSLTGDHIQLANGDFVYTRREALGVCVGIGAWNYPTQIACWKAAPALACGNTSVFKPSETTPLSAVVMTAFALGTAPALTAIGLAVTPLNTRPRARRALAVVSMVTGLWVLAHRAGLNPLSLI